MTGVVSSCAFPDTLYRYAKPSWIDKSSDTVKTICFDLRAGPPPEDYVSFYASQAQADDEVCDIFSLMAKKEYALAKNGRMLKLRAQEAYSELNKPKQIISFQVERWPHFGMYYSQHARDEEVLEVKTMLQFYSDLCSYQHCSAVTLVESSEGAS